MGELENESKERVWTNQDEECGFRKSEVAGKSEDDACSFLHLRSNPKSLEATRTSDIVVSRHRDRRRQGRLLAR